MRMAWPPNFPYSTEARFATPFLLWEMMKKCSILNSATTTTPQNQIGAILSTLGKREMMLIGTPGQTEFKISHLPMKISFK